MKKIDLGQTISIVANLGILAGLVLLAVELNQNNQLIRSAGVISLNEKAMEWNARIAENHEVAEIISKANNSEILTDTEQIRLTALTNILLAGWVMDFLQYQTGLVTEDYMNGIIPRYKDAFRNRPFQAEHWETAKDRYPQEFVHFMDECVIGDCQGVEDI